MQESTKQLNRKQLDAEFSEMLESYVTAKKVNKYQMAKYLSVDRSSLHKIIQGQRNAPSKDLVLRIGNYLELTPYEIKELLELYSISLVSPDIYYRRKNVDTFIRSFHTEPTLIDMPGFQNEELSLFEDPVRPFHKIGNSGKQRGMRRDQIFGNPGFARFFQYFSYGQRTDVFKTHFAFVAIQRHFRSA